MLFLELDRLLDRLVMWKISVFYKKTKNCIYVRTDMRVSK